MSEELKEELTATEKKELAKAKKETEKLAEEAPFDVDAYLNERVPFYAILDDDKYKDDIFVTVNGNPWQIQRGAHVEIPRFVYNALVDVERQKRNAVMTSRKYEEAFKAESNKQ